MPLIIKISAFAALLLLNNPVLSIEKKDAEFFFVSGRLSAFCDLYFNDDISSSKASNYIQNIYDNSAFPEYVWSNIIQKLKKTYPNCPVD